MSHLVTRLSIAVLVIALLAPLVTVAHYPYLDLMDEALHLDIARSYPETGRLTAPQHRDAPGIFAETLGYNILLAGWMQGVGFGIVEGRLFHLLFKIILIAAVFAITQRLYGREAAFPAAAFAACSFIVFEYGLLVRLGVPMTALVAAGAAVLLTAQARGSAALAGLAGALMGAALQMHPNAIVFCLAAGIVVTIGVWRWGLPIRVWIAFALGGVVVGGGLLLGVQLLPYYLPNADNYAAVMPLQGHSLPLLSGGADALLLKERARWSLVAAHAPTEILVTAAALLAALIRRSPIDRALVAVTALTALLFVLLVSSPSIYYVVNLLPLTAPLVGALVMQGIGTRRTPTVALALLVLAATLLPMGYRLAASLSDGRNAAFYACAAAERARFAPETELFFEQAVIWLAFPEARAYTTSLYTTVLLPAVAGVAVGDGLARVAPDALFSLYDGHEETRAYAAAAGLTETVVTTADGDFCWRMWARDGL